MAVWYGGGVVCVAHDTVSCKVVSEVVLLKCLVLYPITQSHSVCSEVSNCSVTWLVTFLTCVDNQTCGGCITVYCLYSSCIH